MNNNLEKSRVENLQELEEISFRSYATYVAGKLLTTCFDLQELSDIITDMFVELMRVDSGCLMLFHKKSEKLNVVAVKGIKQEEGGTEKAIETNKDFTDWVVKWGNPILMSGLNEQPLKDFFQIMSEKTGMEINVSLPLVAKDEFIGLINLGNKESLVPFYQKDLRLLSTLSVYVTMAVRNAKLYDDLLNSYLNTVSALAEAIESKDPYTRGHSERVSIYAAAIARAMKLNENEIELIRVAGVLHDIGKIGIPEKILLKFAPLSNAEFTLIKEHPIIGDKIIEKANFPWDVRSLALHHHERYDGSGYPDGQQGEDIPVGSRILAVADTYEALRADRPYRQGFLKEKSLEIIREVAGGQLDRKVVGVFLELVEKGVIE
ncbi:MAG: HD domain-containing phosphohydrolase [Syntrophales bacterium]